MKDIINKAVKYRETFRPFAPAVLEEHQRKIFKISNKRKVYFMERVYQIKSNWKKNTCSYTCRWKWKNSNSFETNKFRVLQLY